MHKGMILKKLISHHDPDIYVLIRGLVGRNVAADIYFLSDSHEKDRRIRGLILPAPPLLEKFRPIHPFSPEMDLARSLFRLPPAPVEAL